MNRKLTLISTNRGRKSEQMVPIRRSSLHHRGLGHGVGHGTGPWLSLFWTGTKKVRSVHDLGLHGFKLRHHFSMVLLGLFFGILTHGHEWIHR